MPTADTAPQGPGLEDAATAMSGLLDRESGTPAPEDSAAPPDPAPPDEGEGVADAETPTEETPPDEGEPEADEAADTSDEDASEAAPTTTARYTVRVNGKEEQVTLEEALKGYSRTRDYTQKTDALATDRHVLEQERAEVLKERSQYKSLLMALQGQLEDEPEPDWEEMYRQSPLQWAKARDDWRTKQDKLAAANYELQRLAVQAEQEQRVTTQAQVAEGKKKMLQRHPEWNDPKTWEADRVRIIDYAQTEGYSHEEIANALDPRAIIILDKARRWDEYQATKKPVPTTQRVGPRVAAPGSAPIANNQNQRARQRLAQTGRIDDAAKVFMNLIE